MQKKIRQLLGLIILMASGMAAASVITLNGTVRDVKDSHSNFQNGGVFQGGGFYGLYTGLVESTLGSDGKPVYVGAQH